MFPVDSPVEQLFPLDSPVDFPIKSQFRELPKRAAKDVLLLTPLARLVTKGSGMSLALSAEHGRFLDDEHDDFYTNWTWRFSIN